MFDKIPNQSYQVDKDENINTVKQSVDEPTIKEMEWAVDKLENGKAPGKDAIIA